MVKWGHDAGALMTKLMPLEEETLENLLSLSTHKEEIMWAYSKMVVTCKPGEEVSAETRAVGKQIFVV